MAKYTADQLKAMLKNPAQLKKVAMEFKIPFGTKKPADVIREILSKQNGGKTPATAAAGKAVMKPGQVSKGSLTAKPKTPTPIAKPGAVKAPVAAAPKAAAPAAKPVIPSKAPAATPGLVKKPAPAPVPAGTKPISSDADAKFKALIEKGIASVKSALDSRVDELEAKFASLSEDFNALKEAAGAAVADAPEGEEVAEEGGEGEAEVELTQEAIEAMDGEQLSELAGQLGIEIEEGETEDTLRAKILEAGSAGEGEEEREVAVDLSWAKKGENAYVLYSTEEGAEPEWMIAQIKTIDKKTNKIAAIVFDPASHDPETDSFTSGWECEPLPTEIMSVDAYNEAVANAEPSEEAAE